MNGRVAGYSGLAETLARKVSGTPRAIQVGAEYDDLYQEGLIFVWQSLGRGVYPSKKLVEAQMRSYVRWLGYQTGQTPKCRTVEICPQHVPYETLLPLDDFRRAEA